MISSRLTDLSGKLMSELWELFGKLSRRWEFFLANRNSISLSRSRGNVKGGSRGGGSCDGDESDESDETGVADPHENLKIPYSVQIGWLINKIVLFDRKPSTNIWLGKRFHLGDRVLVSLGSRPKSNLTRATSGANKVTNKIGLRQTGRIFQKCAYSYQ